MCVCFSLAVSRAPEPKLASGLSIVNSLVPLCPLLPVHMHQHTQTHTHFHPITSSHTHPQNELKGSRGVYPKGVCECVWGGGRIEGRFINAGGPHGTSVLNRGGQA